MNILIIPDKHSIYDYEMVKNFALGFEELGCSAVALSKHVSDDELETAQKLHKADLIIHINTLLRKENKIGKAKYISWIQDYLPSQASAFAEHDAERSRILAMGSAAHLGIPDIGVEIGSLNVGVPSPKPGQPQKDFARNHDLAILGFIPKKSSISPPHNGALELRYLTRSLAFHLLPEKLHNSNIISAMVDLLTTADSRLPSIMRGLLMKHVEVEYSPLTGTLNVNQLNEDLTRLIEKHYRWYKPLKNELDFISQTFPRYLDRILLGRMAVRSGRDLDIWGNGWFSYSEFQGAYRGILQNKSEVLEVLASTTAILCNNTHGIFIHPTVLDAIAQGAFVFWHETPITADVNPSLIDPAFGGFEPNRHFGLYSPKDFVEAINSWSFELMTKATLEARGILMERHLWKHRARTVLDIFEGF
jgi:hypothetical protein